MNNEKNAEPGRRHRLANNPIVQWATRHVRSFVCDVPRPRSFRARVAEVVFLVLLILSRDGFVPAGVLGCIYFGSNGLILGPPAVWLAGLLVQRSMGLRGRDLRHGFFVRMLERGNGQPPGILERLIERLRGDELTLAKCHLVAGAYGLAKQQLQTVGTEKERQRIHAELDRKVLEILYHRVDVTDIGSQATPSVEGIAKGAAERS